MLNNNDPKRRRSLLSGCSAAGTRPVAPGAGSAYLAADARLAAPLSGGVSARTQEPVGEGSLAGLGVPAAPWPCVGMPAPVAQPQNPAHDALRHLGALCLRVPVGLPRLDDCPDTAPPRHGEMLLKSLPIFPVAQGMEPPSAQELAVMLGFVDVPIVDVAYRWSPIDKECWEQPGETMVREAGKTTSADWVMRMDVAASRWEAKVREQEELRRQCDWSFETKLLRPSAVMLEALRQAAEFVEEDDDMDQEAELFLEGRGERGDHKDQGVHGVQEDQEKEERQGQEDLHSVAESDDDPELDLGVHQHPGADPDMPYESQDDHL